MGSPARDQNVRLPERPLDNGVIKRKIFEINNVCFEKIGPNWLQNQRIKIIFSAHSVHSAPRYEDQCQVHDASGTRKQGPRPPKNSNLIDRSRHGYNQSHCEIFWQGPSDNSGDTSGAPEAHWTHGVEDQLFEEHPEMRIDSHNNGASIRESELIEGPTVPMEWELLPSRNSGAGDIYRCQRHCRLHPVRNDPGRSAIEENCPDRMVDFPYRLQGKPGPVQKQRHKSIRFSKKHAIGEILELVPRQGSRSNRRLYAVMVSMEERVLLPTVELDPSSNSESLQRTVDTNTSNPTVTIGNVVSRPNEVGNPATNILTSNSGGARPQKRQVAFDEEQVLAINGLAHKRRALLGQGLENQAIDFILSNPRTDKRMRHYDPTQQHFLAWNINQGIIRPINAANIVNFLAKSYVEDKLALSTIKAYKSLRKWVPFFDLEIKPFTSKLCWLLSICRFLRASDIRRIDKSMTIIFNDVLRLVVVAPKEKRGGQPIMKPCEIKSHADPLLCPVDAYKSYILHVKDVQCMRKHDIHPDTTLSMLIRHIRDFNKPLSVESISRHVHMLSDLILRPPNTPRLKTRALVPILAAAAGVTSSDIVVQEFWSNYYMFDNYYRLSRSTNSNIAESVLPLE
ncbi:hypothetical protein AYI69_g1226 [Smittium culicis]|uniref:Uncharacterized protein n=1 Tax=Smittium culicis TaxID=133412 RepID=A0A1R1YQW6_9FUNG|nr:hypothetical protein AYI69_g1226 [Smittium culicis]